MHFVFPSKTIEFAKGDVAEASAVIYQLDNEPVVNVRFSPVKAKEFGLATGRNVGNKMKILVCGRLISEPVIRTSIEGGAVIISGNFNLPEAQTLANVLMTGVCVEG